MANMSGFDASKVEPNQDFEAIPDGKYLAMITASEMKPTKSGNGEYMELVLQIVEGPYKGRSLWDRLNLNNPSEIAVKIARGALSAICRAVNVLTPKDSEDLHNLPLVVRVVREEYEGGVSNKIKGYSKRENGAAPAKTPAPTQAAAPAAAPWATSKK